MSDKPHSRSRSLRDYIQSEVTAFYADVGGRYVVVPDSFLLELEEQLEASEKYAAEGWAWLDEALDALGAKTVFKIKERKEQLEALRSAILELPRSAAPGPYTYVNNEDLDRFWQMADAALASSPAKEPE